MAQKKHSFLNLALCMSLLLVVACFQACNRQLAFTSFESQSESTNGTGYDGKLLAGTYVRLLPNLKCQNGIDSIVGLLQVSEDTVQMMKDNCTPIFSVLDLEDSRLFYTPYNRGILAINGAIFELQTEGRVPDFPYVEAWCSNASVTAGSDVVIHSNADHTQFKARFVSGKLDSPQAGWSVTAFDEWDVTRTRLGGKIAFQSADATVNSPASLSLELTPNANLPRTANGQLTGRMVSSSPGGMSLNCFTGDEEPALAPQLASLKAAWSFDHTPGYLKDGDRLTEVSSQGHQGIARMSDQQGLAIGTGRFGSSLSLINNFDSVDISSIAPPIPLDFSVSLWFSKDQNQSLNIALLSSRSNSGNPLLSLGFNQCGNAISNEISVVIAGVCLRTGKSVSDYLWHQIGLAIQSNQARLFVDGAIVDTQNVALKFSNDDKWAFGPVLSPTPLNPGFVGRLDEVLIWNQALSNIEMSRLYLSSKIPGRPQDMELKLHGDPQLEPYAVEAVLVPRPPDATVDFYVDGVFKATQGMPPFSMFGDGNNAILSRGGVGPGSHVITARYRITGTSTVLLETSISVNEGPAATGSP